MNKNKLGVSYSLFCGEELLKCSILSIRGSVDYINVVWQEYSWTGEKANEKIEALLQQFVQEGLINNIIKFEFDPYKKINKYGRLLNKKKNLGLRDLKKHGCTHVMLMDVDEFYRFEEFSKAKQFVYEKKITHSACSIYDYRILPIYRQNEPCDYCVPFIFKLTWFSRVSGLLRMPCYVDPNRTFPFIPFIHKFYYLNMINMHHMTGVRKNYAKKLRNTLSHYSENGKKAIKEYAGLQKKMEKMTEEEILESGYIKVPDEFKILEKWEC